MMNIQLQHKRRLILGLGVVLSTILFVWDIGRKDSPKSNRMTTLSASAFAEGAEESLYVCPMHPHVHSDRPGKCPICGMDLVKVETKPKPQMSVQPEELPSGPSLPQGHKDSESTPKPKVEEVREAPFAAVEIDARRRQLIGVRTAVAQRRELQRTYRAFAEVEMDENRLAHVHARVEGWIEHVHARAEGTEIRKGQPLFTLYSPEILATTSDWVSAAQAGQSQRQTLIEERLQQMGVQSHVLSQLKKMMKPVSTVSYVATHDGIIIDAMATGGMAVMPGTDLFKLGDYQSVWVIAQVYGKDVRKLKLGQKVAVESEDGNMATGTIQTILPMADKMTRASMVRIVIENDDAMMRPNQSAIVRLPLATASGVVVPEDAVYQTSNESVVIVDKGDGYYEPRTVKLGLVGDDGIEIIEGVSEGESVVTGAKFFVDSESNLRAAMVKLMQNTKGSQPVSDSKQHQGHGR